MKSPFSSPFFKRKRKSIELQKVSRRSLLSNNGEDDDSDYEHEASNSKEPVSVYLRIKPIPAVDEECVCAKNDTSVVLKPPQASSSRPKSAENKYSFSKIFKSPCSQKRIFQEIAQPIVKDVLEGKNGLIFCYGITNSGKTFTMEGGQSDPGILIRCLDLIFSSIYDQQAKRFIFKPNKKNGFELQDDRSANEDLKAWRTGKREGKKQVQFSLTENTEAPSCDVPKIQVDQDTAYSVFVSYIEIYNEQVFDLLQEGPTDSSKRRDAKKLVNDSDACMFVKGQTEVEVKSTTEAYEVLKQGQSNRQVASTRLNYTSSRSHSIFNIRVVQAPLDEEGESVLMSSKYIRAAQLSLVDLAGSERYSRTQSTGQRLKEAGSINTSLMTLHTCMEMLRRNQTSTRGGTKIVPYRNSKLTHLFKTYFEGNGKVAMIVCINPGAEDYDETVHVLKFATITQDVRTAKTRVAKWNTGLTPGRGYANKLLKQMKDNLTEEEIDVLEKSGLIFSGDGDAGDAHNCDGISIPSSGILAQRSEEIRNDLMVYEKMQEDKWDKQMKMMEETEKLCRQMLLDRNDMLNSLQTADGAGKEKALNSIKKSMEDQNEEIETLRGMLEPLKDENESKDREVKKLFRQITGKEKEVAALSKLLAVADVKIEELNEQTERLQCELQEEMNLNKTLREELAYASSGLEINNQRHDRASSRDMVLKDKKIKRLERELDTAASDYSALEEEVIALRTEFAGKRYQHYQRSVTTTPSSDKRRLEGEISTLERQIESLNEEVCAKNTEINALKEQVSNFKRSSLGEPGRPTRDEELAGLESELSEAKEMCKHHDHELNTVKRSLEKKNEEVKYLKTRNRELEIALEDDHATLKSELAANTLELKNKDLELRRLQRKLGDVQEEMNGLKDKMAEESGRAADIASARDRAETSERETSRVQRELNRKIEENDQLKAEIEVLEKNLISTNSRREREMTGLRDKIANQYRCEKQNWLEGMQTNLDEEMNLMQDKLSTEYQQKVLLANKIKALKQLLEDDNLNISYTAPHRHLNRSSSKKKPLRRVSSAHQVDDLMTSSRIVYDAHNTSHISDGGGGLLNRSCSAPTTPVMRKKRYWWQRTPTVARKGGEGSGSGVKASKSKSKKNKRLVDAVPSGGKAVASRPGGKLTLDHVPAENADTGTLLKPHIGPSVKAETPVVENFLDKNKNLKVNNYVLNHQEKRGKNIFTKLFKGNVAKSISNKGFSVTFTDAELMKMTDPLEENLQHNDESFTSERKRKLEDMYPYISETETELDTSDEANSDSIKRRCAVGINNNANSGVRPSYYHIETPDHPHRQRPTPAPRPDARIAYDEHAPRTTRTPATGTRLPSGRHSTRSSSKPKWRF